MSDFTNPASRSTAEADAYVRGVLEVLGDRDPLPVLAATHAALTDAIAPVTERLLSIPEAEGKWSVREVLRHLADSEIVWGWRLRMVLAEERPPLTGYDQDAWAERLGYRHTDPGQSLEEFGALRRGHLGLLERASPGDLRRVGLHRERGEESLEHMVRLYAGHDLVHLTQVERILRTVEGPG